MTGAARRIERDTLQSEVNAYLCARLVMIGHHQPKKFPAFRKVSSVKVTPSARPAQTWEQQKEMVKILAAAFGAKVVQK